MTTTNSARGHVPAPDLREGTGHYQLSVRHNGQRMLQSGTQRGPLSDPDGGRQSRERTAWCEPYVPGRRLLTHDLSQYRYYLQLDLDLDLVVLVHICTRYVLDLVRYPGTSTVFHSFNF